MLNPRSLSCDGGYNAQLDRGATARPVRAYNPPLEVFPVLVDTKDRRGDGNDTRPRTRRVGVPVATKSQTSAKSLVIVESPAKAKTINRYLGSGYTVMASMGHVRDLPESDLGIQIDRGFEPVYEVLPAKRKTVRELKKVADQAHTVYLATDLDREGEAIAWHLVHALDLDLERTHRVVFNEITESAIKAAFSDPHKLDMDKVNAQQARRLLDRIVGYQLSPLLQAKLSKGLSAGRVQSVAVRLIVDREKEIRAFIPEESWRIVACFDGDALKADTHRAAWEKFLEGGKQEKNGRTQKDRSAWLSKHGSFSAELVKFAGAEFDAKSFDQAKEKIEALGFVIDRTDASDLPGHADKGLKQIAVHGRTDASKAPPYSILDIQKKRTSSKPNAPFTTASIQQAASTALGFAPSRTMRIAQALYEGVDLGDKDGPVGLITYMRTDSTNLSKDSISAARDLIRSEFGDAYLPEKPNVYASRKSAQEAHEAIRPTDAARHPDSVRSALTAEQHKLYDLIWRRFVACQMTPAQWDNTTVLVGATTKQGEAVFRASGRTLAFDGFLRVMGSGDDGESLLPELQTSAKVGLLQVDPQQLFSSPPARYSEAALVKKLEAEGIGRPSTYAAIIQTVQDRGYVELREKRLYPTPLGEMVTEKLVEHFPAIMDFKFTSYMEEELDKIEEAHLDWVRVLEEFYEPFKAALDKAQTGMERGRAEPSEYTCKDCSRPMVYRWSKNGRFLSCSGYPECRAAMNLDVAGKPVAAVFAEQPCSECGKPMMLRRSRLGPFLGCTGYPDCTSTLPCDEAGVPLKKVKPEDVHEICPDCSSKMSVKFARGKAFLGCTNYPKCRATTPIPAGIHVVKPPPEQAGVRCDKCGRAMVIRKSRRGPFLSCSGFPRCRNAMPMEKLDHLKALNESGAIPDAPAETNGRAGKNGRKKAGAKSSRTVVDVSTLGAPPKGFAWTRTGRPVVETWPEDHLNCPDCKSEVIIKPGRYGPYFSCTNYPKCSFVANLRGDAKKRAEIEVPGAAKPKPVPTDIPCDECGENMVIRTGRTGPFLGCSKYPKCRAAKPLPEGMTAEVAAGS